MVSRLLYVGLLAAVGVQRLLELRLARRNTARAREQGAVELGRGHLPFMVALHVALLAGCVAEVWALGRPFRPALGLPMLGLLGVAQALRMASMRALGPRWSTRVLVVPGAPLVDTGIYAVWRHPNYAAVAVEGVALPLVHGAWVTALLFTALNVPLLALRIRCEERALATWGRGGGRLWSAPRFLPALASSLRPVSRDARLHPEET